MRCFPDKETFYYQVGDGDIDHEYWGPPELQRDERPTYYVATPENPGSDVAGRSGSNIGVMYLSCKDRDLEYAENILQYAKGLYEFGMKYRGNSKGQLITDLQIIWTSLYGLLFGCM